MNDVYKVVERGLIPVEEFDEDRGVAWINKGLVDYEGSLRCEQCLNALSDYEWRHVGETRLRRDARKKNIFYEECKFIIPFPAGEFK